MSHMAVHLGMALYPITFCMQCWSPGPLPLLEGRGLSSYPILRFLHTHTLIRQGYVDELVQSARTQDGRVNDVRPVSGPNDEDILFCAHSVHLSQNLIDDTISCTSCQGREDRPSEATIPPLSLPPLSLNPAVPIPLLP